MVNRASFDVRDHSVSPARFVTSTVTGAMVFVEAMTCAAMRTGGAALAWRPLTRTSAIIVARPILPFVAFMATNQTTVSSDRVPDPDGTGRTCDGAETFSSQAMIEPVDDVQQELRV